jgi:hypothetical protein
MSEDEKAAYFESKNKEYFEKLQKELKRPSKTKKIVKFGDKFQVKYFNSDGSAE